MFKRESELRPIVLEWLRKKSHEIASEFRTPWGICDLVGIELDPVNVRHRLSLRQRDPIGNLLQAHLIADTPDVDSGQSVEESVLIVRYATFMKPDSVQSEIQRLERRGFLVRTSDCRLQKRNGWHPIFKRIFAVELKLDRVSDALYQAMANLELTPHSYAAFPVETAKHVRKSGKWDWHLEQGVGLIAVSHKTCRVIHQASGSQASDDAVQLYSADRFWKKAIQSKTVKHK